jgi:hypothetical protein
VIARLSAIAIVLGAGFMLSGCSSNGYSSGYYDPYPYRSGIYYHHNYYYNRPPATRPPQQPPSVRPPQRPVQ